jgi:hypothetical protein
MQSGRIFYGTVWLQKYCFANDNNDDDDDMYFLIFLCSFITVSLPSILSLNVT